MSENKPQIRTYKTKGGRIVSMLETDPYTIRAVASGEYVEIKPEPAKEEPKAPTEPAKK